MKRFARNYRLSFVFIALASIIFLDVINIGHYLVMFVIAGQIPGTQLFVPADTMLLFSLGMLGVLTGRLTTIAIAAATHRLPSSQIA